MRSYAGEVERDPRTGLWIPQQRGSVNFAAVENNRLKRTSFLPTSPGTIVVVLRVNAIPAASTWDTPLGLDRGGGAGAYSYLQVAPDATWEWYGPSNTWANVGSITAGHWYLVGWGYNGSSVTYHIVDLTTGVITTGTLGGGGSNWGNASVDSGPDTIWLGGDGTASQAFDGCIASLYMFSRAATAAELAIMSRQMAPLRNEPGLSWLSLTHPKDVRCGVDLADRRRLWAPVSSSGSWTSAQPPPLPWVDRAGVFGEDDGLPPAGITAILTLSLAALQAALQADVGVTGGLSAALSTALTAQADVGVTGDLSAASSTVLTAQADVGVTADLALTLAALAAALQADLGITGDLAATMTTVLAAQADVGITADLAATLNAALAGQGDVNITADLSATLAALALAAQADVAIEADLAAALAALVLAAAEDLSSITATLAISLLAPSFDLQADVHTDSDLSANIAALTAALQGDVEVGASLAATIAAGVLSGTGDSTIQGDLSANLQALSIALQGDVTITASMQVALQTVTLQMVQEALYVLFTRRTRAASTTDGRHIATVAPASLTALPANRGTTTFVVLDE